MVKSVIGEVTTYYVGSYYEKKVVGTTPPFAENARGRTIREVERKYYSAGSSRIAMRENGTITWLLGDHLGSTSVTADASGNLLDVLKYTAFGELRSGSTATDYKYTGQRNEFEIGLYYYVARYYDPQVGRFIQADTVIPGAGNPQSWNRYSYVNNNPVNFNDPSGHKPCNEEYGCEGKPASDTNVQSYNSFYKLPIDPQEIKGVQWFGGTKRAYDLWKWKDTIYGYCQYGHCGLDLLADYGTPVYAGVYGKVIAVYSLNDEPARYEGPWKIMVQMGDYVITYGHTDGTAYVTKGQYVTPTTLISGVGNMGGYQGSGEIDHIHLEVRGPGGWGGPSQNPLQFLSPDNVNLLVEVAKHQTTEIEMSQFTNGQGIFNYPPPAGIMPDSINRTSHPDFPFYVNK